MSRDDLTDLSLRQGVRRPLDAKLLDRIRALSGVRTVEQSEDGRELIVVFTPSGKAVRGLVEEYLRAAGILEVGRWKQPSSKDKAAEA